MRYRVKELFHTLQGEGMRAGRAAVFCRFSGCNLWTGRPEDRPHAVCPFCDTDFVGTDGPGGGIFEDAAMLAAAILATFPYKAGEGYRPYVVFTGGEPALQLDRPLIDILHAYGCEVAIETNGTVPLPEGLDWVTVSPKAGTQLVVTTGDELKLVWPQQGMRPEAFEGLDFTHLLMQPRDGLEGAGRCEAESEAVQWCLAHPRWRLCLQTHKYLGIP